MAKMPRIRDLHERPPSDSALTVGQRRESPHTHNINVVQEDALRALLADDPNNANAFKALVDVVARNCSFETSENQDPLHGNQHDDADAQNRRVSLWALAEEYSGHPKAWRPLVELARLSIELEPSEALRRLQAAVARDASGEALAEAVKLYVEKDRAAEAYNLAIGQWKAREHVPEAGVAIVRAAVLSEKQLEADIALRELLQHATPEEIAEIDPELLSDVHGVKN